MKLSSFITLKELSQNADQTSNYSDDQYISPKAGVDIYIRAVDKIANGIKDIAELTTKIAKLNNSPSSKDKADIPALKQSLTEQYLKMREIIDEFIKGFSLAHDDQVKELMSLFYRGFSNVSEHLDLGYITGKSTYYQEALNRLEQTRSLFTQMLELLQKEVEAKTSHLDSIDVSNTLNELEA